MNDSLRWQTLVSSAARGETLSDADAVFLEEFASRHPREAELQSLWNTLGRLSDEPWAEERSNDDIVRAALAEAPVGSMGRLLEPAHGRASMGTVVWLVGGLLAAAMGVVGVRQMLVAGERPSEVRPSLAGLGHLEAGVADLGAVDVASDC